MCAVKVQIEKLLVLQDKDARLASIQSQLDEIPRHLAQIAGEKAAAVKRLSDARAALKAMEEKREAMRAERRALEAKVAKYKTQLLETKKNDDYVALNGEIDKFTKIASDMEGGEIEFLFKIDEANEAVKKLDSDVQNELARLDEKVALANEAKAELDGMLGKAQAEADAAMAEIEPDYAAPYKKLKAGKKKFPIVVQMRGEQCGGCFLKASTDTLSKLKKPTGPVMCEQCGRILYE